MIGREIERGLEAAQRFGGGVGLEENEAEIHAQCRIGGMVLDERAIDLLRARQLPQLEEREPEQIARPLVAGLVAKRFLQRDPRLGRIPLLEEFAARRQRAIELLVLGEVGVVFLEDAAFLGAGIHHFPGSPLFDATRRASRLSW